jgi:hypothetical protein
MRRLSTTTGALTASLLSPVRQALTDAGRLLGISLPTEEAESPSTPPPDEAQPAPTAATAAREETSAAEPAAPRPAASERAPSTPAPMAPARPIFRMRDSRTSPPSKAAPALPLETSTPASPVPEAAARIETLGAVPASPPGKSSPSQAPAPVAPAAPSAARPEAARSQEPNIAHPAAAQRPLPLSLREREGVRVTGDNRVPPPAPQAGQPPLPTAASAENVAHEAGTVTPSPVQGARPQQAASPTPARAAPTNAPRPIQLRGPRRAASVGPAQPTASLPDTRSSQPAAPTTPTSPTEAPQPRPRLVFLPEREAAPSSTPGPTPSPASLPASRGPRPAVALANHVASGLAPLLGEAHRVSNDALPPQPSSASPSTPSQATGVQNTFNVNVHLGAEEGGAGLDRTALEQVLTEILRDAARRNGLEV